MLHAKPSLLTALPHTRLGHRVRAGFLDQIMHHFSFYQFLCVLPDLVSN